MDEAYLQAVRNAIRTQFSVDENHCEVTPDGKATPISGQWYFAVHPGDLTNTAQNCLDERMSLKVTVTMRTGVAPVDRVGVNKILPTNGLIDYAKRLRALLHMSYPVMDAANALITGTPEYVAANGGGPATVAGYAEPLMFLGMTYLGPKGPDWFFAEGQDNYTGLAVELRFGRARRAQYIESQT